MKGNYFGGYQFLEVACWEWSHCTRINVQRNGNQAVFSHHLNHIWKINRRHNDLRALGEVTRLSSKKWICKFIENFKTYLKVQVERSANTKTSKNVVSLWIKRPKFFNLRWWASSNCLPFKSRPPCRSLHPPKAMNRAVLQKSPWSQCRAGWLGKEWSSQVWASWQECLPGGDHRSFL